MQLRDRDLSVLKAATTPLAIWCVPCHIAAAHLRLCACPRLLVAFEP